MKKLLIKVIVGLLLGLALISCKKDKICNCVKLNQLRKIEIVKGVEFPNWSTEDTLEIIPDGCSRDNEIDTLNQISRTIIICK